MVVFLSELSVIDDFFISQGFLKNENAYFKQVQDVAFSEHSFSFKQKENGTWCFSKKVTNCDGHIIHSFRELIDQDEFSLPFIKELLGICS